MTSLLDNINVKVSRQFVLTTVRPFGKILLAPVTVAACRTAPRCLGGIHKDKQRTPMHNGPAQILRSPALICLLET